MGIKLKIKDGIMGVSGVESLLLEDNKGRYYTYKDGSVELADDIGSFITVSVDEEVIVRLMDGTTLEAIASALDASEDVTNPEPESDTKEELKNDALEGVESFTDNHHEDMEPVKEKEDNKKEDIVKLVPLKGMTAFYLGE